MAAGKKKSVGKASKKKAVPKKKATTKKTSPSKKKVTASKAAVPKRKAVPKKKSVPKKKAAAKKKLAVAEGGMKRFQSVESQQRFSRQVCAEGGKIGFVPTMGAFHAGHLSLVKKARSQNDIVIVSIFVNPLQFSEGEDFERYPRDLARDLDQLRDAGVDAVFLPEPHEMYGENFTTTISVGEMATRMCGAYRPGHFDGVCTVVAKLLGIVMPQRIYLGEKDAQQLVILRRMIADLNIDVRVVAGPIVREKDGLALSSRNTYLSEAERAEAPRLYEALRLAQREILVGQARDPIALTAKMRAHIEASRHLRVRYIEMVDPESLEPREVLTGRTLIALSVDLGETHLIDNLLINVPGGRMAAGFSAPA